MNDTIIQLFKYFARFVSKEALSSIFIQPDPSRMAGYAEVETEIMTAPDTRVIPAITRYVVSVNENFVAERIKNLHGLLLFLEYGKITLDHDRMDGIRQTLALTLAHPFSDTNSDNLNEILLMNQALEILDRILRTMNKEQHELDFCGGSLLKWPAEIQPVDPVAMHGCGGWSATFTNAYTLL